VSGTWSIQLRAGAGAPATTNVAAASDHQRRIAHAAREAAQLRLPAQAQLLPERPVPVDVLALQVLHQAPAPADEQQQPVAAVVVMLVHLQVLGEIVDSPGQQRDLDFRRAGVTLTGRIGGSELYLAFNRSPLFSSTSALL